MGDEHDMQRTSDFDIVDHLVSSPRLRRKIALKFVRLAVKFLGVDRRLALDRDVRPDQRIVGIQLEPALEAGPGIGEDGFGWAFALADTAVDALIGMNDELFSPS